MDNANRRRLNHENQFFCKLGQSVLQRSQWSKLDLFIPRFLDSLFETISSSPSPFFYLQFHSFSFYWRVAEYAKFRIESRRTGTRNRNGRKGQKGCGRDGRDRRNPIARITNKYECLERSCGSHRPSTISPLSIRSLAT